MDEQNPSTLPEDLTALDADGLTGAETSARTEAEAIRETPVDDMTDAQVDRLEALAEYLNGVDAEVVRRGEVAAERARRVQEAADRIDAGGDAPADETDAEAGDADAPEGADADAAPVVAEPTEADVADAPPVAVAASAGARRRAMSTTTAQRMRQPANPKPAADTAETRLVSLVAAADVGGGISAGSDLGSIEGAVPAFIARSSSFPQGPGRANVYHKLPVAQIQRHHERTADGLYVGNPDFRDTQSLLRAAADEKRLPGGSLIASNRIREKALVAGAGTPSALVAAGGWCAPSTNLYGMCANETLDGIIDLPETGVDRGGINYTPGPDFSDIYTSAGFIQTEAEAIAGETKDCAEVDCPDFDEVRLDAVGICVKAPLLTRAAYPELVQRWLEGTVIANQHKVAARLIAAMRTALGTALAPVLTGTPITWSTLTAMELVIEGQRQAYRLSESETLEVKVPRWVRVAIRADLANRNSIGADSVTNAQIAQHFADRGAAVQFILGYDELPSPKTVIAFPSTTEIMVYPAGTFVKGTADVISLDTVYDTADLRTNVYTAAFVEDGVLLAKMCHGGARITIPVNVTGMLGAAQLDDTWGTAQIENAGAAAA